MADFNMNLMKQSDNIVLNNNDILARHELKNDIEKPTKYSATLIIYVISSITKNFKPRHSTMSNYQ